MHAWFVGTPCISSLSWCLTPLSVPPPALPHPRFYKCFQLSNLYYYYCLPICYKIVGLIDCIVLIRHTLISNPRSATAAVHIFEISKDWLIIMWFWELLWTAMNTIWGLKRMLPSPNKTIKHFWKCICIHLILIWSVDYIDASASSALLFISQDGSPQQKNKNTYVTYANHIINIFWWPSLSIRYIILGLSHELL
jgi:hypothetical protein